jgi:hypothetical protein
MVAEVVAGDGFVERFHAVVERGGGRHLLATPHRELIAFVGVVIGEHVGAVAVEHEEIAVAAVGEAGSGLGAQGLLHAGEPGFGIFPGVEIAVELVGAERVVHVGQVEGAVAEIGGKASDGGELQVAIITICHEAGREIAREGELLGHLFEGDAERGALLVDAVAAERRAQAEFGDGGRLGDDVDDATHGVGAIHGGTRPAHHFDAIHTFERHGDIHVVVAGLRVVDAHAVEQHEGLAEARAADGKIALHPVRRAFLQVERGVELEQIRQGIKHQALAARREHADGAVDLFQRHGLIGSSDDHGIVTFGRLLGEGECRQKREKKEKSGGQTSLYNL